MIYYIAYFRMRFAFSKVFLFPSVSSTYIPISVVICAKNEEENLETNLPYILEQDYPEFEVVVVNDGSTDETGLILKILKDKYDNLKIISLNENINFFKGKKFPLSIGIKSSKYNHLLLTDADCRPCSKNWIKKMAEGFIPEKEIVIGYGTYLKKKGLLNHIIRFDTIYTGMQYFSFALANIPYMGIGRNLAYTKELFNREKGFTKHYCIKSGDDDLFVNSAATRNNVSCVIHPDSFTVSSPHSHWISWFKQKQRHLRTSFFYKKNHKLLLALYPTVLLTFYTMFICSASIKSNFLLISPLFLICITLNLIVYIKVIKKLNEKYIFIICLLYEVILILIYGFIFVTNIFSKRGTWK